MYLNNLNDREKELFLELAYYIANCDQDFDAEESDLIKNFREETGMDEEKYRIKGMHLDNIIEGFEPSTEKNKTTVFLEIMGVVIADLEFNGNEQVAVSKLRQAWNISDEKYSAILHWYEDMDKIWKIV